MFLTYPRPVRRLTARAAVLATVLLVAVGAVVAVVSAATAPRAVVDLHANLVLHRGGGTMTPEAVIGPVGPVGLVGPVRLAVMAGLVGALALGLVLALVLGRGARRRLDRLGPELPPQPNRLVCSLSLLARAELAVWGPASSFPARPESRRISQGSERHCVRVVSTEHMILSSYDSERGS